MSRKDATDVAVRVGKIVQCCISQACILSKKILNISRYVCYVIFAHIIRVWIPFSRKPLGVIRHVQLATTSSINVGAKTKYIGAFQEEERRFYWHNMRSLPSSWVEMCVHIFVHSSHVIREMLHGTSLRTQEDLANCHHAETLHTLFLALLVKFLITYMRMHGGGRSANSMAAVFQYKIKAHLFLVWVWYSFLYICSHILYVHTWILHACDCFHISNDASNMSKCCWGTPSRFRWRSSSYSV